MLKTSITLFLLDLPSSQSSQKKVRFLFVE